MIPVFIPSQLLLAVSACERPVTPSSTFSMLPSVTSFIRASDNQVCKTILAHAQQRAAVSGEELEGEKMQIDGGTPEEEQDDTSLCLFEIEDAEVSERKTVQFQVLSSGRAEA